MQCFLNENDSLWVGSVQILVLKVQHDLVMLGITDPSASPAYREETLYIRNDDDDYEHVDDDYEHDELEDSNFEAIEFESVSPFATSAR